MTRSDLASFGNRGSTCPSAANASSVAPGGAVVDLSSTSSSARKATATRAAIVSLVTSHVAGSEPPASCASRGHAASTPAC